MPKCWNCQTQVSSREEICPVCEEDLDARAARRKQKPQKSSRKPKAAPQMPAALKSLLSGMGCIAGVIAFGAVGMIAFLLIAVGGHFGAMELE